MKYNHIIFDIDGTLIDTEKTGLLSLQKTIKDLLGKDVPYDNLLRYFGIPSHQAIIELDFPDQDSAAKEWEKNFDKMFHYTEAFPGIKEMLASIKQAGITTGIVTSRCREEFSKDPLLSDFISYIDYSVCSNDSVKHKPNPEPMLAYMAMSGAKPEECLYIGDTIYDCKCGKSAGADFALIEWRAPRPILPSEEDAHLLADYVVHNAQEVLNIVALLSKKDC